MGLEKNKIALSFEKAEYYTLQEASDYLNLKYSIDNITPRKLLKHIVSYDISCFVYAKGFCLFGDYEIHFNEDTKQQLETLSDEELCSFYQQLTKRLDTHLSFNFSDFDNPYSFLAIEGLEQEILSNGYFLSNLGCVKDIVAYFGTSDYNKGLEYNYLPPISKTLIFEDDGIKNFKVEYLNMIESFFKKDDDYIEQIKQNNVLEFVGFEEDETTTPRNIIFKIYEKDLIIFHKDLENLEKLILGNSPIPPKQIPKIEVSEKLHPRAENNHAKIISALANMANIDLTKPFGSGNQAIITTMEQLGLDNIPNSDTVAKVLKKAHDISK